MHDVNEAEAYLQVLDLGYSEVKEAFTGLADENVWKRPAEGLLSVGELAGHIAYWEAVRLAGEGVEQLFGQMQPDLEKCRVSSLLIDPRFDYHPNAIQIPPSEQHRAMTADQVCRELLRVHEEAVSHFKAHNPSLESCPPAGPSGDNYGELLRYLAFHIAYHTGQMYTARHLIGEKTPDN